MSSKDNLLHDFDNARADLGETSACLSGLAEAFERTGNIAAASQLVIHRDFEGEHEMSDGCWCRPIVMDSDDPRDAENVVGESEKADG